MIKKQYYILVLLLFVGIVYLLFPTNNSTLDAYGYAADIKYAEDLFSPHHLLYNSFLFSIVQILKVFFPNLDVLSVSKVINSVFVLAILFVAYRILLLIKIKIKEIILLLMLVGFSYNFMRFGTENETYIIPIFFSLLGSLFFVKYLHKTSLSYIFLSGLFASLAGFFHQIHVFWWLGLFIGLALYKRTFKVIFFYVLPALIVPIVYILILIFYKNETLTLNNLIHFILHDYYSGAARTEFGLMNFIMIFISTVRSFVQVHVNIGFLIRKNFLFVIPILILMFWLFYTIKMLFKKELLNIRKDVNIEFFKTSMIILTLQFLFAFYAVGNVEFLVMLPLLLIFTLFYVFKFNKKFLMNSVILLIVWNFMYGLYPNHHYKFFNDEALAEYIIQHPDDVFVIDNASLKNIYYYRTGIDNFHNIVLKKNIKGQSTIDSIVDANGFFYTDIIKKPEIFNRSSLIYKSKELNFENYNVDKVYEYNSLYGSNEINKISK